MTAWAWVTRLPRRLAVGLVRFYQLAISPMLPPACRFTPSCSHYACACLHDHGFVRGSWLTLRRLSRCHPFHPGGYDPPPPALDASASTHPPRPDQPDQPDQDDPTVIQASRREPS